MTQTLLVVILFVGVIATLPWAVKKFQQRREELQGQSATATRVVAAIAVGPHQRVVTVEIGTPDKCVTLVLGVTPQSISCLHKIGASSEQRVDNSPIQERSFDVAMARVTSQNRNDVGA